MIKEITFIGLGRMGAAMSTALVKKGFEVSGFDTNAQSRVDAEKNGVTTFDSLDAALAPTENPKVIWLMVPSKYVDDVLSQVTSHTKPGDYIIDGGNSFFKDSIRRHGELKAQELIYIDCGTSGGVEGALNGASLMVGGEQTAVKYLEHFFVALATDNVYGHAGGPGAGHFVKMIHNGIEYGMMNALAEGLTAVESQSKELNINTPEVLKSYTNGSIITSSLMTWLSDAYSRPDHLNNISGNVPLGETEEEMEYVINEFDFQSLETALKVRKDTRESPSRVGTLIAAMRNEFGGHKTNPVDHAEN